MQLIIPVPAKSLKEARLGAEFLVQRQPQFEERGLDMVIACPLLAAAITFIPELIAACAQDERCGMCGTVVYLRNNVAQDLLTNISSTGTVKIVI